MKLIDEEMLESITAICVEFGNELTPNEIDKFGDWEELSRWIRDAARTFAEAERNMEPFWDCEWPTAINLYVAEMHKAVNEEDGCVRELTEADARRVIDAALAGERVHPEKGKN